VSPHIRIDFVRLAELEAAAPKRTLQSQFAGHPLSLNQPRKYAASRMPLATLLLQFNVVWCGAASKSAVDADGTGNVSTGSRRVFAIDPIVDTGWAGLSERVLILAPMTRASHCRTMGGEFNP
jgi:hypothetical protein